jgi:hypothetical protein
MKPSKIIRIPGLAAAVAEASPNLTFIPEGLKFDGAMINDPFWLLQFTEQDESSPSYGATFYLDIIGFTIAALIEKREQKRLEFKRGMKLAA